MLSAIKITKVLNGIARVSYAILFNGSFGSLLEPLTTKRLIATSSLPLSGGVNENARRGPRSSKMRLLQKISQNPDLNAVVAGDGRRLMSSKSGGRSDCTPKDEGPRCSEKNLAKSGCIEKKKKEKANPDTVSPFKSMWYNPECCLEECPNVLPRFDELYYAISDKAKRKYQQTWINCPSPRIVPKAICCFDQLQMPPFEKRSPKKKPKTACEPEEKCPPKTKGDCPRFVLKGCRKVRNPPKCFVIRGVSDCKKVCAPYPAFSECMRPKLRKGKVSECECIRNLSMCEVWEYYRRMQKAAKRK